MGRSRMTREAQAHSFIFLPGWMRGDSAKKRRGKIEAFEQNADIAFGESGIGKGGDEDFLGGIVEKRAQGVAGSGSRLGDANGDFIFHRRHYLRCFCARVQQRREREKSGVERYAQ